MILFMKFLRIKIVLNIKIKIEKLNIIKNTESVGIEFFKTKNDYEKL